MKYTKITLDKVRDADIVKTVMNYLDLKKSGVNYSASSPFSEDRTASFVVSPAKQMFKCFSTGKGGDGIAFVMEHESLEFPDAVEAIAQIHNIVLEKEEMTAEQQRRTAERMDQYTLNNSVSRKYVATRKNLPADHWAVDMLNQRQFTDEAIIDFQIGFAPQNNELTKWITELGQLGMAKDLGLVGTKNSHSYDKFKNRLMFPIHNHKGAVIAFGGRRSNNEADSTYAKYLNSPASTLYDKSAVLYGLFQAKKEIARTGTAILTEGYTDVIGMHVAGCENTIASCGTALTDIHASLLKKYAQEVVILRDGDGAGERATVKDIDVLLSHGLRVSVCTLLEGEDPDSFARNLDGDMGEWIADNKRDAIYWKVDGYDLIRDRYESDLQTIKDATLTEIKTLQSQIPTPKAMTTLTGEDLKAAKKLTNDCLDKINSLKKEEKQKLREVEDKKIDAHKKGLAFQNICETLFQIKHEVNRSVYIKQVAKMMGFAEGTIKRAIGELELQQTEAQKDKALATGRPLNTNIKLPEGADMDEYIEHGFVTVGNTFHFQRSGGSFFQGTDFKLIPLFHILGDKENKRLCELVNTAGQKIMIDFDSDMLASFNEFRRYLFHHNGFAFYTHNGMKGEHFDRFVIRFNREFQPANELLTMGWHKKGFFAFADGVFWEGKFRKVNKYGIMHLDGIDTTDREYNQKVDYYYSPAFSVMHADNQDGDDRYENDRYFVYKQSPVTINDWMGQFEKVFQDKGTIGVLFVFGSLFRDLFLENYDSFPLLGGFGEKDSGKSAFGKIVQNFFYYRLPALDLTQATPVGLSRRLSRNVNTVQFLDEYQDKHIDDKAFGMLMGAWNGIGREKGMNSGDKRTQYDKVNSALYISGQFMPTRMENALASRLISLMFQNQNFTSAQKDEFNKLLNWTNEGLSSLVVDIIQHRTYFENNLPTYHVDTVRILKDALKDSDYQERVFTNQSMLYTTFRILKEKMDFPFSDEHIKKLCVKLIIENSEQIMDSNGLTQFWSIVEFLFVTKQIHNEQDFKIDGNISFKVLRDKKEYVEYHNEKRNQILYLRLKTVYQWYNKEVTKREGVDVIGETTIRQYFKSRSYFIGLVKGTRFGDSGSQSCYAFDYTAMKEQGLLTLQHDSSPEAPSAVAVAAPKGKDDDLPF
ncbi:DNA primase, catalytic core [Maribacter dokdonensis]|uniref:DNA primase n=1 Tax=Maribacter dokdonensis TaxID=320912 RepID=A0ABY0UT72_9FLAO|nr:DNA primase [Maribacter dokdonensis]SDT14721.1 DNA primase, catalytic core [Maribacter dokdonensis]